MGTLIPAGMTGSSPPVRGARGQPIVYLKVWGLIPARAGSTSGGFGVDCGDGAHPRPCGEHVVEFTAAEQLKGSSPPVRGALVGDPEQVGGVGLIPARAGSTAL